MELFDYYPNTTWHVLKQHFPQQDGLLSMAHTSALTSLVAHLHQPVIHFWTLEQQVILGMMDERTPYFSNARSLLKQQHYSSFIRHSGGLAVVSDKGILNVSLILPEPVDQKLSISASYQLMKEWFVETFSDLPFKIENYEITHSYCPGEYDLSIDGTKFAGMAQRRSQKVIVIMLYLSVTGNQKARGELIQSFYQKALHGETTKWHFPEVDPDVMANLPDLIHQSYSVQTMQTKLLETFTLNNARLETKLLANKMQESEYQASLAYELAQLEARNHLIKEVI